MKSTIKKIADRLDEVEKESKAREEAVKTALADCENKRKEYEKAIRTETDPDRLNELILKNCENDNRYTALVRQNTAKPVPALDADEYSAIDKALKAEMDNLQSERIDAILDALRKVTDLMNDYTEEYEQIERVCRGADYLAKRSRGWSTFNPGTIADKAVEDEGLMTAFCYAYYKNPVPFRTYKKV